MAGAQDVPDGDGAVFAHGGVGAVPVRADCPAQRGPGEALVLGDRGPLGYGGVVLVGPGGRRAGGDVVFGGRGIGLGHGDSREEGQVTGVHRAVRAGGER
jgi:hypothetical protein